LLKGKVKGDPNCFLRIERFAAVHIAQEQLQQEIASLGADDDVGPVLGGAAYAVKYTTCLREVFLGASTAVGPQVERHFASEQLRW
jgi:hypothetical protein